SIMAFCNSGFALFNNNIEDFKFVPLVNVTIAFLLIFGGIGFMVMKEIVTKLVEKKSLKNLSVHTKIVLSLNLFLLSFGTIYLFLGEYLHAFVDMTLWEKLQISFFQSATTRTAGFNSINLTQLHPHSIYMMLLMMFIGASPGSTGGGVKVTTLAVLLQSVTATLKGKQHVEFFERRIPSTTVVKSIAIFIMSLILVSAGLLILMRFEPDKSFLALLFEVTSAFGTVGLTLGTTPFLSTMGKFVIIMVMFAGRVGP